MKLKYEIYIHRYRKHAHSNTTFHLSKHHYKTKQNNKREIMTSDTSNIGQKNRKEKH